MQELYKFCRAVLCVLLPIAVPCFLLAQATRTLTAMANTPIDQYIGGFYVSLPAGYDSSSQHYPLLIFLHGEGEVGAGSASSLPILLRVGIPMQIDQQINHHVNAHFPDPVVVNGRSYQYIVLIPQMSTQPDLNGPEQQMVDEVINYAIAHYRVDTTKIALTGLSMGGGIAIEYPGQEVQYGRRLNSLLGVADGSYDASDRARDIAEANLPVWLTVNNGDATEVVDDTEGYISELNSFGATPKPLLTIFNASGHGGWVDTYGAPNDAAGSHPGITDSATGLNVYQWMVHFTRIGDKVIEDTALPPPPPPVTQASLSLQLAPNPAPGLLNLTMDDAETGPVEVSLVDAAGRVLHQWTFGKSGQLWNQSIDPGSLAAGTYFIVVNEPHSRQVRSFIRPVTL